MSFPIDDPQSWIVTALCAGALFLLVRRALPRRRGGAGCGTCAPSETPPRSE